MKIITIEDKQIIFDFRQRRKYFDSYLEVSERKNKLFTCPSCGFPTLLLNGRHDICTICHWQDDGQDDPYEDEHWGGPNEFSLTESRLQIGKEFKELCDRYAGVIITDAKKVLLILDQQETILENVGIKLDTDVSDPLWDEWRMVRQLIKHELIEKSTTLR